MKLIDFLDFEPLVELCNLMNAEIIDKFSGEILSNRSFYLNNLLNKIQNGEEVEIENLSDISVALDGTLLLGNKKRVVIYIRDPRFNSIPKFHVSECEVVLKLKSENRSSRFVLHQRDDEIFHVNYREGNLIIPKNLKLKVCYYCLKKISWNDREFTLKKFFEKFSRDLIIDKPKFNSDTAALNFYTLNWAEISKKMRENINYTCQECHLYLGNSEMKRFLHTHHINENENDNRMENLKILCYECHSRQPFHEGMKEKEDYFDFLHLRKKILLIDQYKA
jgi:hypothetical protein